MIAASLARALAARRIHYGWLMVSLVFLYGVCSMPFGWPRAPWCSGC